MYIFFSYYGACHFSKRKKVMRIQCKVLSHPPLFSGPDGMSTATPSALESEAVHLQFSVPPQFPLRALLSSLLTPPPPSLLLVPKVILKKNLRFLFLLMFSLTGRTLVWGQRFRQSYCCGGAFQPCLWGWGDEVRRAGSFRGPPPTAEHLPLSLLCFLVGFKGGQTAWFGERRGSCPGWGGDREGVCRLALHRGCGVPGIGLDKGLRAGCPPGPRPWMSTRGTRGRCSWGWGAGGVRYMLLYMAAAAAAAVVLSMLPSRLGW